MKTISFLFIFFFLVNISVATIRNVPAAYQSISSALSACQTSDTVLVQPGTYAEQISWPYVADIKLISAGDSSNTIISAGQNGRVLSMNSNLITNSTLIRGFSIRDGLVITTQSQSQGAGIELINSSPTLDGLLVEQNRLGSDLWNYGAGIYIAGGTSNIINCTIRNNAIDTATWGYGAGIYIGAGANVQINNTNIDHNETTSNSFCYGVGIFIRDSEAKITASKIVENLAHDGAATFRGVGIYIDEAILNLENVLIASNIMGNGGSFVTGGGIHVAGDITNVNLKHVTIAENYRVGNLGISGSGIFVEDGIVTMINSISYNPNNGNEISIATAGTFNASYSNIRSAYTGIGNIDSLPQFLSATDYHLSQGSPCLGAGNPSTITQDLDGLNRPQPLNTNPDMGCYETNQNNVGFVDFEIHEDFIIAPNPVSDFLLILLPFPEKFSLHLFDCNGREVFVPIVQDYDKYKIDSSNLGQGIYKIVLSNGEKSLSKAFVKK